MYSNYIIKFGPLLYVVVLYAIFGLLVFTAKRRLVLYFAFLLHIPVCFDRGTMPCVSHSYRQ